MYRVRAFAYGALSVTLIATGVAALIDGNSVGVAALVGGAVVGGMAGLFGYVASTVRRNPAASPFPSLVPEGRGRLVVLGAAAGILALSGVAAIVLGLVGLVEGHDFVFGLDVGIFLLAFALINGTSAWARWPVRP